MYVPIVLDPCAFYEYRYLWEFLMYEYHCYLNNWPIITREKYKEYRKKRPISNVYEEKFCRLHQYRILQEQEEQKVKKYYITENIFAELKDKCGSRLGMKLFLLKNRYKPLEKEIKKILLRIQQETGKKIKGILNWNMHFYSIRYIAEKMKIPVITNEFAIRFPEYYSLGYLCKKDIYGANEVDRLYDVYLNEKNKLSFPLFTRKELLVLFLNKTRLQEIDYLSSIIPKYEIGVAGCHPLIATFFSKSTYTDYELIEDVRQMYYEEDILFRKHPGDEPYQAEYTIKNKDSSKYASAFIANCKRITAVGSNILLEAMLWGKTVYSEALSPYAIFAKKSLNDKNMEQVDDSVLNFILLGFLVPYNKMFNEEYIDWRLKEHDVIKIMESNIRYYFREMKIPENILFMKSGRYEKLLIYKQGENHV